MGIIMEDFYYEESNPKHVLIKCLGILFLIGICVGIFFYQKDKNTIKLKTIKLELGETLSKNVEDYLTSGINNAKNYKLDISEVDENIVGEYTYKVIHNKHIKKGKVIVKDTTKPVVETDNIEMNINEELEPRVLVSNCKDLSLPCSVIFKDEKIIDEFKVAGTYEVDIIVSDAAGNKVETTATVTSSETGSMTSVMSNDLDYYTNSEKDDSIEHTLFVKFKKAMDDDSEEFVTIIQETSVLDFSEYTEDEIYSMKLLTAYNKYGYAIGLQVIVTHPNGTIEYLEKGDS